MAENKKKKYKKRKKQAPPLSTLDKNIYALLLLVLVFFILSIVYLQFTIPQKIAFSNEQVVAFSSGSGYFLSLPVFIYFSMSAVILITENILKRKPVFGNKNVNYSDEKYKRVYPIFGKDKKPKTKPDKTPYGKTFWCVGLSLTLILAVYGLRSKTIMINDLSCQSCSPYSVWTIYPTDDYESISFEVYRLGRSRSKVYEVTMRIYIKDKSLSFSNNSFRSFDDAITYMKKMKGLFPDEKITYENKENIEQAIKWLKLNESEQIQLYELFNIN